MIRFLMRMPLQIWCSVVGDKQGSMADEQRLQCCIGGFFRILCLRVKTLSIRLYFRTKTRSQGVGAKYIVDSWMNSVEIDNSLSISNFTRVQNQVERWTKGLLWTQAHKWTIGERIVVHGQIENGQVNKSTSGQIGACICNGSASLYRGSKQMASGRSDSEV